MALVLPLQRAFSTYGNPENELSPSTSSESLAAQETTAVDEQQQPQCDGTDDTGPSSKVGSTPPASLCNDNDFVMNEEKQTIENAQVTSDAQPVVEMKAEVEPPPASVFDPFRLNKSETNTMATATSNNTDDELSFVMVDNNDEENNNNNNESKADLEEDLRDATPLDDDGMQVEEDPMLGLGFPLLQPQEADLDMDETHEATRSDSEPVFGGLMNMGNTCYMNSALQMLASLDAFPKDLEFMTTPVLQERQHQQQQQREGDSDTSNSSPLRNALLEVLHRLGNGETFEPHRFKECVDARTGLFMGFEQQDAHEFLTTLLDLLDEDYRRKNKEVEGEARSEGGTTQDEVSSSTLSPSAFSPLEECAAKVGVDAEIDSDAVEDENDAAEDEACNGETDQGETDQIAENPCDEEMDAASSQATCVNNSFITEPDSDEERGSSPKKLRLDDEGEYEIIQSSDFSEANPARSTSYLDLEFNDIENLLYGDVSNTSLTVVPNTIIADEEASTDSQPTPKCKLIGGRMNTSDVVLTRYENGNDQCASNIAESNTPQLSSSDDMNNKRGVKGNKSSEFTAIAESPIDSSFTTDIRVCLTCDSCKFRRSHTEKYLHLSLEMGPEITSVEDGLRRFFAPEDREIKCEKCFYNKCTVTKEVVRLPKTLLLHLKRFIVDVSPDYTSISYRKDRSAISFKDRMPLNQEVVDDDEDDKMEDGQEGLSAFLAPEVVVSDGSSFALRSVVNHIGSSASCGHYTADSKRFYPAESDGDVVGVASRQWTRFNDEYVSKISASDAVDNASTTAYLILYEMEDKEESLDQEQQSDMPSPFDTIVCEV